MTREEISERATLAFEALLDTPFSSLDTFLAREFESLVRATLQEAARAVCPMCREHYEVGKDEGGLWVHDPFNGPEAVYSECKAPKIHDLIAELEDKP